MIHQSAQKFLMIKPAAFGFNTQSNRTNHYSRKDDRSEAVIYSKALKAFEALRQLYESHDIDVTVFENKDRLALDAIFPNSISTFPAQAFWEESDKHYAILHPMLDSSRRRERSPELIAFLTEKMGYKIKGDLTHWEEQDRALEGTGSVVMDHVNRIAYCGLSERSNEKVAREYVKMIGYELVPFRTRDHHGIPIYHTDILMYVGSGYLAVCADCIHEEDRERVLTAAGRFHDMILLSMAQLRAFCGNAVQMRNKKGKEFLAMSTNAFDALKSEQKDIIEKRGVTIIHADIAVVEKVGGGSVRCMTQELF